VGVGGSAFLACGEEPDGVAGEGGSPPPPRPLEGVAGRGLEAVVLRLSRAAPIVVAGRDSLFSVGGELAIVAMVARRAIPLDGGVRLKLGMLGVVVAEVGSDEGSEGVEVLLLSMVRGFRGSEFPSELLRRSPAALSSRSVSGRFFCMKDLILSLADPNGPL